MHLFAPVVSRLDDYGNEVIDQPAAPPARTLWPNQFTKGCKNMGPWYIMEGYDAIHPELVFNHKGEHTVTLPSSIRAYYGDARTSPEDNKGTVCFQVEVDVSIPEREPEPEPVAYYPPEPEPEPEPMYYEEPEPVYEEPEPAFEEEL